MNQMLSGPLLVRGDVGVLLLGCWIGATPVQLECSSSMMLLIAVRPT